MTKYLDTWLIVLIACPVCIRFATDRSSMTQIGYAAINRTCSEWESIRSSTARSGENRREPELEHSFPAISCLCRGVKFAPRLLPGDVVAYKLRKGRYGLDHPQRRLTAVLRVLDTFPMYAAGATWYEARNLPLPGNCWVPGNSAQPLGCSHNIHKFVGVGYPTLAVAKRQLKKSTFFLH